MSSINNNSMMDPILANLILCKVDDPLLTYLNGVPAVPVIPTLANLIISNVNDPLLKYLDEAPAALTRPINSHTLFYRLPAALYSILLPYWNDLDKNVFKRLCKQYYCMQVRTIKTLIFKDLPVSSEQRCCVSIFLELYKNITTIKLHCEITSYFLKELAINFPKNLSNFEMVDWRWKRFQLIGRPLSLSDDSLQKLSNFHIPYTQNHFPIIEKFLEIINPRSVQSLKISEPRNFLSQGNRSTLFGTIEKFSNLESFKFSLPCTERKIPIKFDSWKQLRTFHFDGDVNKREICLLSSCQNLTDVKMNNFLGQHLLVESNGINFVKLDLPKLELSNNLEVDISVKHLCNVRYLSLPCVKLPDEDRFLGLVAKTCKSLEFFAFGFCKNTEKGIEFFATNALQLKYLQISGLPLGKFLSYFSHLKALQISNSPILSKTDLLQFGKNNPNLEFVSIYNTYHSKRIEDLIEFVNTCKKIKYCYFNRTLIEPDDILILRRAISNVRFFESSFNGNKIPFSFSDYVNENFENAIELHK